VRADSIYVSKLIWNFFCFGLLPLAQLSQPIRCKAKTGRDPIMRAFPRLAPELISWRQVHLIGWLCCLCFFWLAVVIALVLYVFRHSIATLNWKTLLMVYYYLKNESSYQRCILRWMRIRFRSKVMHRHRDTQVENLHSPSRSPLWKRKIQRQSYVSCYQLNVTTRNFWEKIRFS